MAKASLTDDLNRLAGTTHLAAQGAANVWAGTTHLDLVGALNVKAGTHGLELQGVLNSLAGTHGIGEDTALDADVAGGGGIYVSTYVANY